MLTLYNLLIRIYGGLIMIAAPINKKARAFINGRKTVWKHLEKAPKDHVVWFHAASLGEFEQGKPVMEALKQAHPEINLVVTFFSPSGYSVRKDYEHAFVLYLPLDTPINAKRFISTLKPKLAIFIKYEFWANYLDTLHHASIPTAVIAAQFRPNQFLFSPIGAFIKKRIARHDLITVQYPNAKDLLLGHGFDEKKISVCGDSRFDRVQQTVTSAQEIPELALFCGDSPLLILGSCYEQEVHFALNIIRDFPEWKVVLAPHFVDNTYVSQLEKMLPEKAIRFTDFAKYNGERFLIINTIGKLAAAYRYGDIAVVGGGFRGGIHNTLEPAAFGLPVFFGPKHHKFPEANAMIAVGVGFEINNTDAAGKTLKDLLTNTQLRKTLQEKTTAFVCGNVGATNCIIEQLKPFLS